jgi:hypothetical protein
MNDPTNQPKAEKQPEPFWPYAVSGIFLLVVFVAAILTPDYFNYQLRLARIQAASKISTTNLIPPSQTGTAGCKGESAALLPAPSPSKVEPESLLPPSTEPKNSEIFETYGKLLTMLLAIVSVLGVFFGYFVRKSLREVEEDMRRQVMDTMGFWEKEKIRFFGEVNSTLEQVKKQQSEVSDTIASSKQVLEVLKASAKAEGQKLSSEAGLAATAVAEIDSDDTIPAPPGGE